MGINDSRPLVLCKDCWGREKRWNSSVEVSEINLLAFEKSA